MATYKLLRGNHCRREEVDGKMHPVIYDPRVEGSNIIEMEPKDAARLNKPCSVLDGPRLVLLKEVEVEIEEKAEIVKNTWVDNLGSMHWQRVNKLIADMDTSDEVIDILEAEETDKARASVLTAARARLKQLN